MIGQAAVGAALAGGCPAAPLDDTGGRLATIGSVLWPIGLHVPLAIAMWRVPALATLHALITIGFGMFLASAGAPRARVANVLAYITGAEVLWRISSAPIIFWETGKYAIVLIVWLTSRRGPPLRRSLLPWGYILLLLPSTALTVSTLSLVSAQDQLSFNLSGPLALSACAGFFCRTRFSPREAAQLLTSALGPIGGVLAVTMFATSTAKRLEFTGESNFDTSAGYGPNQVSAMLGLGALLAVLLVVIYGKSFPRLLKQVLYALALAFSAQSALTFSRTGLYLTCLGLAAAGAYALRDARLRVSVGAGALICYLLASYVIAPRLNEFTHGALAARFSDKGLSRRDGLMRQELKIFSKYPLLGVGPGMSRLYRPRGFRVAAHTEFTRLLSEHGVFGASALGLLAFESWRSLRRARGFRGKALVAAMLSFGLCFMLATGMRLALPSFLIGLAFATFDES